MEGQSNSNIQLPPGFRFHPSDEELIVHYLRNKVTSNPVPASIIAEVDLYKHDPWELPKKALFGDNEWYFFSPRDRKYPNGERPNRAAASGYWKATGTDKPILTSCRLQSVGVKKALVFYMGRPPRGTKTNWIMQEYRLPDNMVRPSRLRGSMRLDEWVLCRVRQKDNTLRNMWEDQNISNTQPFGYSPVIEEQSSMNIDPTLDAYENYLKNGCPLLAWILASQNNPRIETTSFLSFQGGNNSNNGNLVHEEDISDLGSSLITDSSINGLFNPLKRKPFESHLEYESLLPLNKKLVNNSNKLPNSTTELSFCRQYPDYNMFNPNPSNPNIEFQDLRKFNDEVLERRL